MEEKSNNELLEEEIQRQLNYLKSAPVGSEEAKAIIDDLVELSKISAEQTKLKLEAEKNQNEKDLNESKLKQAEEQHADEQAREEISRKEEKKARVWDRVLQGVSIGVPIAVAVIGQVFTNKQLGVLLKFEQTGEYVTSSAGKSLIGSLFRKKN